MPANFKKVFNGIGIVPTSSLTSSIMGELEVSSVDGTLQYYDGTARKAILTQGTLTLNGVTSIPNLATVGTITTGTWNGTSIAVAYGGTGRTTLTNHGVLVGAGTSAVTQLSAATAGTVLTGQGVSADPSFSSTITLGVAGTAQGSLALAGSTSGTVSMLVQNAAGTYNFNLPTTAGVSGQPLLSGGGGATAMTFGPLDISTSAVTGTLPIANGGTGQTTATTAFNALAPATAKGGLIVGSGTNTYVNLSVGSDGQVPVANSGATNGVIWTTLQQGSKNYILYNNFENNATTGWSLGTVGTLTNGLPTGTPTFGSGASGNLSISTVSSGQLAGIYSLSLASSAATTQGNMLASQSYAIDSADQAKVLQVRFSYSAFSGSTNCNFSGTSSNSFAWALYDVTNSSWLTSAGNFNFVQSSGVGTVLGTCQTNSNTANIRLVVYFPNATAGAATIYLDDFYVGPQIAPSGPVVGDWTSFTPTGSISASGGSNAVTYTGLYRRVGDSLEMSVNVAFSGSGGSFNFASSQTTINIPNGWTIDNNKTLPTGNDFYYGSGSIYTTVGNIYQATIAQNSSTSLFVGYLNSTPAQNNTVNATTPSTFAAGGFIKIKAKFPISGWSSNSLMSSDTDTRVIAARATKSSGSQTSSGSFQDVSSVTSEVDTSGSLNASTGVFTVPVSGTYHVHGNIAFTNNSSGQRGVRVYHNNTTSKQEIIWLPNASYVIGQAFSCLVSCNAGDTLRVQSYQDTGGSLAYVASSAYNTINFERLSGPAVIAASESVVAAYNDEAGTSIVNGNTAPFATKLIDTHGAWSGTLFTAPISGSYRYEFTVRANGAAWSTSENLGLLIYYNGSSVIANNISPGNGSVTSPNVTVSGMYKLKAGDTIRADYSTGKSGTTVNTGATSRMHIYRVGN